MFLSKTYLILCRAQLVKLLILFNRIIITYKYSLNRRFTDSLNVSKPPVLLNFRC